MKCSSGRAAKFRIDVRAYSLLLKYPTNKPARSTETTAMRSEATKTRGDYTNRKKDELPFGQDGPYKERPQTGTTRTYKRSERPWSSKSHRDIPSAYCFKREAAQHAAALDGARKSRNDKFESRFTFSHSDPKYYAELPAQPATGWWKALIASRRQCPAFLERLCRNLDILLPDTIYSTSTECYYITNNPQALNPGNSFSQQLSLAEKACNGWIIKEDFSASKLFEKNAALYLASSGFPGGKMRLRSSAQLQHRNQRCTIESAMAAPAALVKQPHYAAANKNITKALDLPSTCSLLADSSSERLVQVRHHWPRRPQKHYVPFHVLSTLTNCTTVHITAACSGESPIGIHLAGFRRRCLPHTVSGAAVFVPNFLMQ